MVISREIKTDLGQKRGNRIRVASMGTFFRKMSNMQIASFIPNSSLLVRRSKMHEM